MLFCSKVKVLLDHESFLFETGQDTLLLSLSNFYLEHLNLVNSTHPNF